jgi:capsular polysaccharide transport system permease protein
VSVLAAQLRAQGAVVYALFLREMNRKYAESRLGFLMAFIDPLIAIALMCAVRYYVRGHATRHGMPLVLFVMTGYMVWYAFRHTAQETASALQQNKQMMMMPQVNFMDVLAARVMVSWFVFMNVVTIMSLAVGIFSSYQPPKEPIIVVYCVVMGLWMGIPFGILMGTTVKFYPVMSYFFGTVFRVGTYCSGAMFTADELPMWLHPYLAWNPIFHVCEIMRTAWVPTYHSPIASMSYPVVCALIGTIGVLLLERGTRRIKFS